MKEAKRSLVEAPAGIGNILQGKTTRIFPKTSLDEAEMATKHLSQSSRCKKKNMKSKLKPEMVVTYKGDSNISLANADKTQCEK